MKKPISQSVAEIEKCATLCDYYAVAENVLKPEKIHRISNFRSSSRTFRCNFGRYALEFSLLASH
jgi:hypothetical protein